MPSNVLMPALSPTMERGTLTRWLKKEGDPVRSGDVLAEIETDKATMEVEAVDEGVLAKIVVPEGTADVSVNQLIAVIAAEGESAAGASAEPAPPSGGAAPPPEAPSASSRARSGDGTGAALSQDPAGQRSYARADQAPHGPAKLAAEGGPSESANGAGHGVRLLASPLARRVAKQNGLDLATVKGSGPHGRIIVRDVTAALETGIQPSAGEESAPAQAPPSSPPTPAGDAPPEAVLPAKPAATAGAAFAPGLSEAQVRAMFEPGSFEEVPLDGMRRTVAKRLTEAKQTVPHFYLTADVALDALLVLREQINAAAPAGGGGPAYKVSVNDFVIKALGLALQRVPEANVVWAEDRILRFRRADIGVAVAVEGGLFTPVLRGVEAKPLSAISNEMRDLAARARARRLKPEEYQGGSAAISNLGMFGVRDFAAVINPPHATILAVGAGEKRVVVIGDAPKVATMMTVTLSTDHRAVDGALGARVLQAFKGLIEAPLGMLV